MTSSLSGRRILVTRPRGEADGLLERLRSMGAEPVEAPAIELVPVADTRQLDAAVRELSAGGFEWVVFTSHRGVEAVVGRLEALGLPKRPPGRVAAIGPATSRRLGDAGMRAELLPGAYTTADLAAAFPAGRGRVLLPRADIAETDLEEALAGKGWTPVRVDAYRTRFLKALPRAARVALEEGRVDALTFTSASTVRGFARMAGVPRGVTVVCIGPATAAAARREGFTVDAVASPHTAEGLLRALEDALGRRR